MRYELLVFFPKRFAFNFLFRCIINIVAYNDILLTSLAMLVSIFNT